jgi:hypothetical protein
MGRLNSRQFHKTFKIFVAEEKINAPSNRGFKKLKGTLWYVPRLKKVVLYLSATRSPTNKGPDWGLRESLPWLDGGDFKGMRKHLLARLNALSAKIKHKDWPLEGDYMAKCSRMGHSPDEFKAMRCAHCSVWYCEHSDG